MTNIDSSLIKNMLDNAVHIGHKKQYWSPKMKSYIFGEQNGIHVFDLYKTAAKLEEVKQTLKEFAEKGKDIIFVGTKIQAQKLVKEFANETGNFYVMNKWVPGLLTNYSTIKKRIIAYTKLEKDLETGALNILNKKEKSQKMKELEKFKKAYEGVKELKKLLMQFL
ncbi:30S ribosomal protein S2 [Candidatus Gracilibacteria bacterium]|nr:30S ribosomal protein S2 [Candidatus Gracilibacteria bacterium]